VREIEEQPPSLAERVKRSPVTFALAAINVAVFVYAESRGSTMRVPDLLRFGAVEQLHVAAGDYWRLCTSMFLHIGWMHLLWNTYASVGWCTVVESVIGKRRFFLVYVASGIGGACASALFQRVTSAGASGAMFGIIGATLALRYRVLGSAAAFVRDRFVRSNFVNMAIWTVIGLTAVRMDNFAHGGGLVVGTLTTLAATSTRPRAAWAASASLLAVVVTLAARPGWTPRGDAAEDAAVYATAYAHGLQGFTRSEGRAGRLADLACRDPATAACAQAGWALRDSEDRETRDHGAALVDRACRAGYALACGDRPLPIE